MEAQRVVDKILADARAEAEKITQTAEQRMAREQQEVEKQLAEYRKHTEQLAASAAEDRRLRLLAAARMEIRKGNLAVRRQLLDGIFATAAQRLRDLDDGQHLELINKLLLKAAHSGEQEVIVGTNEKRIEESFINRINSELASQQKGSLRLSSHREDIDGGFILRQGKIKTNVSLEVLLARARQELQIELAKELFCQERSG
jgi:V/A-type H+-transporting ATPase subunit E